MAWNPFGVSLELTATGGTVTRTSATQFTVKINASWETYYSGAQTNYGMTASSGGSSVVLNKFGTKSSGGSGSFTGTYSISGYGSATKTITVTFKNYNDDNGDSATKNVTFSVTVPAWPSYTIKYNANGGSGAPSSQTKYKNVSLTISSTKPTRTGYTFQGWSLTQGGSVYYSPGSTCGKNENLTLYAVWKANTYTVTFNANGGSLGSVPSTQTKTYGVALTLPTAKPTRTNYTFQGWSTSTSATTAAYVAGGSYTTNAAATLYAVWSLSYTKPRITNVSVSRCDSSGSIDDSGEYVWIQFDWSTDRDVVSILVEDKQQSGTDWYGGVMPASGTSGTCKGLITSGGSDKFDLEYSYQIRISVSDGTGTEYTTTVIETVPSLKLPVDIRPPRAGGELGVSIGKTAEKAGYFDVGLKALFRNGVEAVRLEEASDGSGVDLNSIMVPNAYRSVNGIIYTNSPPGLAGTFTLEVLDAGDEGQLIQRVTRCEKGNPLEYVRHYYQGAWGGWIRKFGVDLYDSSSGSNGPIKLSESLNKTGDNAINFKTIEIYYTDNNKRGGGYTKVRAPHGKTIDLHCIEAGSTTSTYIRRTRYTISDDTITPSNGAYFVLYNNGTIGGHTEGQLVYITKVIGYEYEM